MKKKVYSSLDEVVADAKHALGAGSDLRTLVFGLGLADVVSSVGASEIAARVCPADVRDGARIMFGGFGGAGFPNNLIQALARKGVKNITAISNNCGTGDGELGLMFKNNQIKHVIASFPGPHANHFQERFAAKQVTLELVPQGVLCERMRAAGAGLRGFYTTVGVGGLSSLPSMPSTFVIRETSAM